MGGPDACETAKFVIIFDKKFDMMNVQSLGKGTRARKPFLQPYRFGNDFIIDVSI